MHGLGVQGMHGVGVQGMYVLGCSAKQDDLLMSAHFLSWLHVKVNKLQPHCGLQPICSPLKRKIGWWSQWWQAVQSDRMSKLSN